MRKQHLRHLRRPVYDHTITNHNGTEKKLKWRYNMNRGTIILTFGVYITNTYGTEEVGQICVDLGGVHYVWQIVGYCLNV